MAAAKAKAASPSAVSNEQAVWNYFDHFFESKGFSAHEAAIDASGAAGNIEVESTFNPAAFNAREQAQGIEQWEGGRGDSGALGAYARRTGGSVTSLSTQLGYSATELNGPYSRVIGELRNAPNAAAAAMDWSTVVEGNAPGSDGSRQADANQIYAQVTAGKRLTLGGLSTGTTITQDTSGGSSSATLDSSITSDLNPINWIEDAANGTQNAVESAADTVVKNLLKPVLGWLSDAMLVILGVVLVIVALVVLAKSADDNGSSAPAPDDEDDDEGESSGHEDEPTEHSEGDAAAADAIA